MSITFNDLLTDPKYREMQYEELWEICKSRQVSGETLTKIRNEFDPLRKEWRCSKVLFNHLQKLKAESEMKAEPKQDRYPMCKDQPAQIDCVRKLCKFNEEGGKCNNISPAISLNDKSTFVCWSEKRKSLDDIVLGEIEKSKKSEPIYGKSPILDHINAIESQKYIDRINREVLRRKSGIIDMYFKDGACLVKMDKSAKKVEVDEAKENVNRAIESLREHCNPEHPITITDQKAREICAKYFNCNPNEIKIV